jgi:hypothetical protein
VGVGLMVVYSLFTPAAAKEQPKAEQATAGA